MSRQRISLVVLLLLTAGALVLTQRRKVQAPGGPEAVVNMIASSQRELTRLPATFTRLTDEEEIKIGDKLASNLPAPKPGPEQVIATYLQQVGSRVAQKAQRRLPYKFHYLPEAHYFNAFALPGGHVVVGAALLAMMDSEDQLAAVLGHEVEHIDLYHCAERVQIQAALRKIPLGGIVALPMMVFHAGYTKDQEMEADRTGTQLAVLAGYSAAGALRVHEKFERLRRHYIDGEPEKASGPLEEAAEGAVNAVRDYFRSHPLPSERIAQIKRLIADQRWDAAKAETDLKVGWVFWSQRAKRALERGNYSAAVNWATRSLTVEPRQPEMLQMLGEAHYAVAQFAESATAWRRLLEINPESVEAMRNYADALAAADPRRALGEFQTTSLKAPQIQAELAGLAALQGDFGPSAPAIRQAETHSEGWEMDWLKRLGWWHYRARKYDTARLLIEVTLPEPNTGQSRFSNALGFVLLAMGQGGRARDTFETNADGFAGQAVAQWQQMDLDRALAAFRSAIEGRPSWKNPRWVGALYAPEVGAAISQMLLAEENLRRKQKLRKELPEVLEQLAAGNFNEALRLDPSSAEAYFRRGVAQAKAGRVAAAIRDLERALQIEPKRFEACETLDPLLARRGQFDRMIGHWSGLIQLDNKNGRAFFYRAQNHARKGDLRTAVADAERACALGVQDACRQQTEWKAGMR